LKNPYRVLTGINQGRALSREDFMSDHEGVRRRDVLKGIGTGAAGGDNCAACAADIARFEAAVS
jgi:hypothetical protein